MEKNYLAADYQCALGYSDNKNSPCFGELEGYKTEYKTREYILEFE